MLAVAVPAPLRPTLLAVDSCTRQHANLLVRGQIVSGLVIAYLFLFASSFSGIKLILDHVNFVTQTMLSCFVFHFQ
jgi:hypothetical protein